MRVFLKKMLVFSLKASSRSGCFEMSAVIGPRLTAGHREIGRILVEAERLAPAAFSSLRDEAGDPWHLGSSKSLTQTLSFGESRLKVVLTQDRSSAEATSITASDKPAAARTSLLSSLHLMKVTRGGSRPCCAAAGAEVSRRLGVSSAPDRSGSSRSCRRWFS